MQQRHEKAQWKVRVCGSRYSKNMAQMPSEMWSVHQCSNLWLMKSAALNTPSFFIENALTSCPQSISNEKSVLGFLWAAPFGLSWFLFPFNVACRKGCAMEWHHSFLRKQTIANEKFAQLDMPNLMDWTCYFSNHIKLKYIDSDEWFTLASTNVSVCSVLWIH